MANREMWAPHERLLFLDVNGTIFDDWEPAYRGVVAILEHFGVPAPDFDSYVREVAPDGKYPEFYRRRGIHVGRNRERLWQIFAPAYYAHAPEIRLMPGVHDAILRMKSGGVEIHILTAARKEFVEPLLQQAGIHEMCDSYHYHIDNKMDQVRAVLGTKDLRHEHCTLVGDIPADVVHAKQAGIRGVGFRNSHIPTDLFSSLVAMDFYALSFEGVADFVLSM